MQELFSIGFYDTLIRFAVFFCDFCHGCARIFSAWERAGKANPNFLLADFVPEGGAFK